MQIKKSEPQTSLDLVQIQTMHFDSQTISIAMLFSIVTTSHLFRPIQERVRVGLGKQNF